MLKLTQEDVIKLVQACGYDLQAPCDEGIVKLIKDLKGKSFWLNKGLPRKDYTFNTRDFRIEVWMEAEFEHEMDYTPSSVKVAEICQVVAHKRPYGATPPEVLEGQRKERDAMYLKRHGMTYNEYQEKVFSHQDLGDWLGD